MEKITMISERFLKNEGRFFLKRNNTKKRFVALALAASIIPITGCGKKVDDSIIDEETSIASDVQTTDEQNNFDFSEENDESEYISYEETDVPFYSDEETYEVSTTPEYVDSTNIYTNGVINPTEKGNSSNKGTNKSDSSKGDSNKSDVSKSTTRVVGGSSSPTTRTTTKQTTTAKQSTAKKTTTTKQTTTTTVATTTVKVTEPPVTEPPAPKNYSLQDICYDKDAFEKYAYNLQKALYPNENTIYVYYDINGNPAYTDGRRESKLMLALLNSGRINADVLKDQLSGYSDYDVSNATALLGGIINREIETGIYLNFYDFTLDTDLAYAANEFNRMATDYINYDSTELYDQTYNYFSNIDTVFGTYGSCGAVKNLILGGMQCSSYRYKILYSDLITVEMLKILENEAIMSEGSALNNIINGRSLSR